MYKMLEKKTSHLGLFKRRWRSSVGILCNVRIFMMFKKLKWWWGNLICLSRIRCEIVDLQQWRDRCYAKVLPRVDAIEERLRRIEEKLGKLETKMVGEMRFQYERIKKLESVVRGLQSKKNIEGLEKDIKCSKKRK